MDRRKFIKTAAVLGAGATLAGAAGNGLAQSPDSPQPSTTPGEKPMEKTYQCKITILRREYNQELADKYLADPKVGPCTIFEDGQEIIVDADGYWKMLHGGFCSEAWDCISRYVYAALQGGSIMRGWTNNEKMMIACCNDGVRPVIFKLERMES